MREQVVVWAEVKEIEAEVVAAVGRVVAVRERARGATAFVPAAVKRRPTNRERPVMTRSVPNAGRP